MLVAAILIVAACGGDGDSGDTVVTTTSSAPSTTAPLVPLSTTNAPSAVPEDYEAFRAQPTACGGTAPAAAEPEEYTAPDDLFLDPTEKLIATINTSCGPIIVELDPSFAPATVNSFVFLARQGYFDGTVSHRILPGFVMQAGDPTGTGRGGPGYVVPDELPPGGFEYSRGVLAMANAGPNSTGSQFFIMLGDSGLPPLYSAYGIVIDGFETLESLQAVPLGVSARGEESVPLETVYIESVVVEPAA